MKSSVRTARKHSKLTPAELGPQRSSFNPGKAFARATELSRRHILAHGHRTYDVLLVAAALELDATDFMTFNERQAKLATAEGLMVRGVGGRR